MRKIKYRKGRKLHSSSFEYTGEHIHKTSEMQLFVYNDSGFFEYDELKVSDLSALIDPSKVNWLNLHGLNDLELLKSIGNHFSIDNYVLSDVLNTNKRTKFEETNDHFFFNIKSILPNEDESITVEQISFFFRKGILLSFQEKRSDFFTHIRDRIRQNLGIIRSKNVDYLLYSLLDAVMENFYITIENEESKLEAIIALSKTSSDLMILERIEKHRDNFNFLKRSIVPLRDSLFDLKSIKDDTTFNSMSNESVVFFNRLYQKALDLLEQIDSDMSIVESATNFFYTTQSHKMNEIMKTLTIVSSVFIPLTFIVGVYGMNFENMPELKHPYGYYLVMLVMLFISIAMVLYFKKRKWF